MRFSPVSYLTLCLSLPLTQLAAQGEQVESTPYPTVTDERLQHPEAGDWLMYRRTYDGSGFSPLRQITASRLGTRRAGRSKRIDKIRGTKTVVPKAGTVLVFKLRKA